ncbi:MAG: crossover junction endodeoxyribonuclease RuvC [Acidimicrobiia bacterium]|nr:crossover junction endodeoxyribonuclease RuvC [Acidimicrobiia bacterium]MDX2467637.1 crossover junction endodeoxyribonuclease RuvC [Acidimicrobiia bacterium]
MFVLGIDPGLSTLGYGIIEARGHNIRAVAAGAIRTAPGLDIGVRLAELYHDLDEILNEYSLDEAGLEQVFVNRNLQTATAVGRASGVALLALAQHKIRVAEYTPSAVKLALTGYGNADKHQMKTVVALRLGLDKLPSPADAADALAIAVCHVQGASSRRIAERAL